MEKAKLNKLLLNACYEYPPDFEKMQKIVDMGADVNAFSERMYEPILSEIIDNYLSEITGEGNVKCDGICGVELCDRMCKGETVNGRDGRYLLPIVSFFFDNGFDLNREYTYNNEKVLYAHDILYSLIFAICGETSLDILKLILSKITSSSQMCYSDNEPIIVEYYFAEDFNYSEGYEDYSHYLSKASKMIEDFAKQKGWKL